MRERQGVNQQLILVLEDDRDLREFLTEALRSEGYAVRATASLTELDTALAGGPLPALIICDVLLRGELPLAALRAIDRDTRLQGLPVIVSTGATHLRREVAAWSATPHRTVLHKPFAIDDLFTAVARLLPAPATCDQT